MSNSLHFTSNFRICENYFENSLWLMNRLWHEGFPIQENVSVKVADNSEIYTDDMSA